MLDEILAQTAGQVDDANRCLQHEHIWHVAFELSKRESFQAEAGQHLGYFVTISVILGSKRSSWERQENVFCYECHNKVGLSQLEADFRLDLQNECHASLHKHHQRSE